MTLGDVLTAIRQGAIDGAIAAVAVFTNMQYQDAAKYITETNQAAIFLIVEISQKWFDTLPEGGCTRGYLGHRRFAALAMLSSALT